MKLDLLIGSISDWLSITYKANSDFSEVRQWCDLGFDTHDDEDADAITPANIAKFFDRKDLNEDYKTRYNESSIPNKKQSAFVQLEINLVTGFHKSYAARHRTRLQSYKDDCVQKRYHTASAITMGYEKFLASSEKAEDKR